MTLAAITNRRMVHCSRARTDTAAPRLTLATVELATGVPRPRSPGRRVFSEIPVDGSESRPPKRTARLGITASAESRRRRSVLRGLLERVRELEQTRLAARHAGEAHPEWRRLRVEACWKGGRRRVRRRAERHDDRRISGPGRERGAERGRKDQRVETVRFHRAIDAVRRGHLDVACAIRLVARTIVLDVHFVRDIELRLPVLDGAGALV